MTPYYATGAYLSAIAHPFHVQAYASWSTHEPTVTVGFRSVEEARAFAIGRPEPLIDLVQRGRGVIACRRAIPHPLAPASNPPFVARDDFPQPGALVCLWQSVDGYGCNFRAGHVGWHERHRAPGIPAPDLYR